jgi:MFS transporter, DHA1 family, multidrug resistance protein
VRRAVATLVYLGIFIGEVLWNGLVPLVPELSQHYQLSTVRSGVLLAATSAAILVVSLPAAAICERFGPRRLTALAVAVSGVASAWQGLASSYAGLVGARLLFGLGFGVVWITGIRWLSEIAGEREAQALSLTVTTAGLSAVVGPPLTAYAVARLGMGPPFVALGIANLALALAMWFAPGASGRATSDRQPLAGMLAGAVRERLVVISLLVMSTAGLLGAAVNLLVPLQLHANGVSTTAIGAAFGLSAGVFIVCSALVARAADRAVKVRVIAWGMVLVVVVVAVPLASQTTAALTAFLLLRAPFTALMFTTAFPLGAIGARQAGITVGAVAALINIAWSVAMLAGPVMFAAVAQTAGDQAAYVVLMAIFALSVAWVVTPGRAARQAAAIVGRPREP